MIAIVGAFAAWRAYSTFIFEDAYITYRYAKNLSEGLGFVFQKGERVLGTTTPLYTMLLALGCWLGADIPSFSGVLFAASIGAIAVLGAHLLRHLGSPNAALLFAAACVCGFTCSFHSWGLETPFVSALVLAAVLAAVKQRDLLAGVLTALSFLTRYDAALFAILLFLALWMRRRRAPWVPGLVASAMVLPWLVFARLYFGEWTPNTLEAKAGELSMLSYLKHETAFQLTESWRLLLQLPGKSANSPVALWSANVAIAMGVIWAVVLLRRREPLFLLLAAYPIALWAGYAWIGPPWEFTWYVVPASFMLLLTGFVGWGIAFERMRLPKVRFFATLAFTASAMAVMPGMLARDDAEFIDSSFYRWRVDGYTALSDWVIKNDLTALRILMMEPGYFTFRTGNPVIDGAGLVTKGVHFHGHGHARTEFQELIDRWHPPLIVALFPYQPSGYVLLQSALPSMQLWMSVECHRELFAKFAGRQQWSDPIPTQALLKHPFELDAESTTRDAWVAQGGYLPFVGRPFPLKFDGAPVADDFLYLPEGLTGAETPPFEIDFDRLVFRFTSVNPAFPAPTDNVAQLIINGRVVLQEGGRQERGKVDVPLVSWQVRTWRGRTARLRFVNRSLNHGWLAADHIRSVVDKNAVCFDDFEAADGFGTFWKSSTLKQPTDMKEVAAQCGLEFLASPHAATTFGMPGEHRLVSKPFLLDRDHLSFLMFDFAGRQTGIDLIVDGKAKFEVRGSKSRRIRPIFWDLRELSGREAVLQMTDAATDPAEWIGIDEIYLADG